jgi:hypothetical protein
VTLLNVASVTNDICYGPALPANRFFETKMLPGVRVGRVFQYATPATDKIQSRSKATTVIAERKSMWFARTPMPEAAPALAGRMGNDRPRAPIGSRVARFIPWVDIGKPEVAAVFFNEQRGDQPLAPLGVNRIGMVNSTQP